MKQLTIRKKAIVYYTAIVSMSVFFTLNIYNVKATSNVNKIGITQSKKSEIIVKNVNGTNPADLRYENKPTVIDKIELITGSTVNANTNFVIKVSAHDVDSSFYKLYITSANGTAYKLNQKVTNSVLGKVNESNITVKSPSTEGSYVYKIEVIDAAGAKTETSVTINVVIEPTIVGVTPNKTVVTPGESILFAGMVSSKHGAKLYYTYNNWDTYSQLVSLSSGSRGYQNTVTAPTNPGTYTYSFQAVDNATGAMSKISNVTIIVRSFNRNESIKNNVNSWMSKFGMK